MDVRTETINLLEENIVGKLLDIDLDDNFLTPKAKINKWDYVKLRSFSTAKEIISNMKRQLSEWEKISSEEGRNKEKKEKAKSNTGRFFNCKAIPHMTICLASVTPAR